MLKDLETPRYSTRRSHRTYSPEFKADLVAACQQPGVSIAALAGQHGMNANVLHRWLKQHQRSGCHQLIPCSAPAKAGATSPVPAFVPVQLPAATSEPKTAEIRIELRRGSLSMIVTWPMSAAAELASWATAILK